MLWVLEDAGWRRREAHAVGYDELGRALLDLQAATDQVFDAVTAQARRSSALALLVLEIVLTTPPQVHNAPTPISQMPISQ
ncbi:hypothetical protein OsJ_11279 [Oryza sativa Japonica Group]|uniref:Uncharacterized protein n=1 Tax=Oryza sativa subsp. japonica TaxID=39947 RepID=B9F913_ORYSJ|nr:hypothetical protein OsJ_11279 [Oryza sativa Japonica Group]